MLSLVITLVTLVFTAAIGLLTVLVSVAVPLAIFWFILKQVESGKATIIVPGAIIPTAPKGPQFVKRTRCPSCGAPKVQRSLSAYVYCDFCGLLIDWDFQACLADKRSRLPGPTYEALLRSLGPKLTAAKAAEDREAYRAAQLTIWEAYATACPAALPPRIGDPAFRTRLTTWQADSQTDLDFDPTVAAAFARQQAATQALAWDRSDPFQPKIQPGSFDQLLDAVLAMQKATIDKLESGGWMERHPDHPSGDLFRRMGVSALVQGWIPFFKQGETDRVLERTGLKGEYDAIAPPKTLDGPCPSCGAQLQAVEGAKRVLCYHCGHLAGVGTGTLPCHGCGTPVTLPDHGSLFNCPNCEAELRLMRWSA